MLSRRTTQLFIALCALLPCLQCRHLTQTTDVSASKLPEELKRLTTKNELEGLLTANELEFGFTVFKKNGRFPDVLLSLEVFNPGANADIFCSPYNASAITNYYRWSSQSAQGTDYVFITTSSAYYSQAITDDSQGVADFKCTLKHMSYIDPVYFLEMDVSYDKREMRKAEQEAMQSIYETCCNAQGSCLGWKELMHSVELEEENATREVTEFDFCHTTSNVCDEDGYLIKLSMDRFGLQCPFPVAEISKFVHLRKISMAGNQLTGDISDIAAALEDLEELDELKLAYNRIEGALGDGSEEEGATNPLCALTRHSLKHLHLQANQVSGPLPRCLFSEGSSLRDLILTQNPIKASIPDSIAKDSALEVVQMGRAQLTGTFPESFVHAEHLVFLDLSYNQLQGELPNAFGPSPKLKNIHLSANQLKGHIPDGIANSSTLESVKLDHNAFVSLPNQWLTHGPKTPLVNLDVSYNQIYEEFPVVLSLLEHLSTLYLNDNRFHGPLPTLDAMFPNAWVLNMSNNDFVGSLPEQWTSIGLFQETAQMLAYRAPALDLSYNQLSGRVPAFFLDIQNIPKLLLVSNSVNLEGNHFICPEIGTTDHLQGFEHCVSNDEPIHGETYFDIAQNGGQPLPHDETEGHSTERLAVAGNEDSDEDSESEDSKESDKTTLILVISIVAGILFLSVLVAVGIRYRVYYWARAKGTGPPDVEIATVKPEALNSSKNLEHSKLRSGVEESDATPL